MEALLTKITAWLQQYPHFAYIIYSALIVILSYLAFYLTNKIIVQIITRVARRSKTNFDDFVVDSPLLKRLSFFAPLLILYTFSFAFNGAAEIIKGVCQLLILWVALRSATAFLNVINRYYETRPIARQRPIKGYIQVIIIILYIITIIVGIGLLTGQSPWVLLSGIGALTAVVLLIFRDTILSLVAGIQLAGYDLVRVGDWIEMPNYGADGEVVDIALHTLKVQNWDKTIISIPTHKLTEESIKNWRGIMLAGGRRIKRAIYIDQNSINFLDEAMIEELRGIRLIRDYLDRKKAELDQYNREHNIDSNTLVNGRRLTNIGTFRAYIDAYIQSHPRVNNRLTHMVRQLPPGPDGLPIEIYFFANETRWVYYEQIQADFFDHLLAMIPYFDLRIYQHPTGSDFIQLSKPAGN